MRRSLPKEEAHSDIKIVPAIDIDCTQLEITKNYPAIAYSILEKTRYTSVFWLYFF